jgi:hypothetical protein
VHNTTPNANNKHTRKREGTDYTRRGRGRGEQKKTESVAESCGYRKERGRRRVLSLIDTNAIVQLISAQQTVLRQREACRIVEVRIRRSL